MPGKTNPVICESMIQCAVRVMGNDTVISCGNFGGIGSVFELNVAMPLIADALLDSVSILSRATRLFTDRLLCDLQLDEQRCAALLENSLMLVTRLVPEIGYDAAAAIAKAAFEDNLSIREAALRSGLLDAVRLDNLLNPRGMLG